MKKAFTMILLIIASFAVIVGVRSFRDCHAYSIKYNDKWIIGKTEQQIEQRYGRLERSEYGTPGYDLPSGDFYIIEFNSEGYAVRVYKGIR
ncbi:MAG: hypothetical protein IKK58_01545 [Clostridia bacterium]|nr:hypothetical protein [Clostridia bacterium]